MTQSRTDDIKAALTRWLDRYSPPASMKNNPQAVQDEVMGLLRLLLKNAPVTNYADWVAEVLERCSQVMKTRAYPTQHELGAACVNYRKEAHTAGMGQAPIEGWSVDPALFTSNKMARGEVVGEAWLYGISACEVIARRLVSRETMEAYRSGAFLARRAMYGEEAARAWETDAKERHEAAKVLWRTRNSERSQRGGFNLKSLVNAGVSDHVEY
jgi:hypothetical protein